MSPNLWFGVDSTSGFPRVSGDEPLDGESLPAGAPFSPRERG